MYFAYNLPDGMPSYIEGSHRKDFNQMLETVSNRMELLETALNLTSLSGEAFSLALSRVFNPEDDMPALDLMTPEDIAALAEMLSYGVEDEPRIEWPNAIPVVDTAFVTRKEWESLRMLGLGGSDAAVVMGLSPYNSPQALYHHKRGTTFAVPDKNDSGKEFIFEFGHRVEDLVIHQFCRLCGCRRLRETRMFRHKDYPFITANIDAIVEFPDGRLAVFEAKTTTSFNRDAWSNHSCPPHYVPQCRQYMAVLDDPRIQEAYIGCIYGNTTADFTSGLVARDIPAEQSQIEIEADFWASYVEVGVEPPPSGNSAQDLDILFKKTGYADPSTKNKPVSLPSDLEDSLRQYVNVREERRQAENRVKELKNEEAMYALPVLSVLGKNIKGSVEGSDNTVYTITYTPISRTETDLEKLAINFPDAYKSCVRLKEESSRRLTIKASKKVN